MHAIPLHNDKPQIYNLRHLDNKLQTFYPRDQSHSTDLVKPLKIATYSKPLSLP